MTVSVPDYTNFGDLIPFQPTNADERCFSVKRLDFFPHAFATIFGLGTHDVGSRGELRKKFEMALLGKAGAMRNPVVSIKEIIGFSERQRL